MRAARRARRAGARAWPLELQGDARLARRAPDGSETRLAASRITAVTDADGRFARADAQGAVREVIEHVLRATGRWEALLEAVR